MIPTSLWTQTIEEKLGIFSAMEGRTFLEIMSADMFGSNRDKFGLQCQFKYNYLICPIYLNIAMNFNTDYDSNR